MAKQKKCSKLWRTKNKDKVYASNNKYIENNKEDIKEYKRLWRIENKDKIREKDAKRYQDNKVAIKKAIAKREKEYLKNPSFLLAKRLRSRIYCALKRNRKIGSAIKDLGCTKEELKMHLESKFQPGMSWDNYGSWHVDHIKPLSKFDLSKYEQFKEACHFSNLQPLWAEDNLKKGSL